MNQQIKFNVTDDRSGDTRKVTLAEWPHYQRAGYRVLDPLSYDNAVAAAEGDQHPVAPPMTEAEKQMKADAAAVVLAQIEAAGGTVDETNPDVVAAYQAMEASGYAERQEAELVASGVPMTEQEALEVGRLGRLRRARGLPALPAEALLDRVRSGAL